MAKLQAGDPAPQFTLTSDTGETVSLMTLKGRKIVLYFYPRDSTPGCTIQACEYRDRASEFSASNAVVLGISRDSLESHAKFRASHELNFPLLSDPELEIHKAYGAWGEKKMYGKTTTGVIRTTTVIDEEGLILSHKPGIRAKGNAGRTLSLVD